MLSAQARTLRGGDTRLIPAEELVPGDIVLLESGDKVPADLRLTDVKNLRTQEAALTGEAVPADKSTEAVSAKATVWDRHSMVFSGTLPMWTEFGQATRPAHGRRCQDSSRRQSNLHRAGRSAACGCRFSFPDWW
jgi:P-type E1-E2 ATPase